VCVHEQRVAGMTAGRSPVLLILINWQACACVRVCVCVCQMGNGLADGDGWLALVLSIFEPHWQACVRVRACAWEQRV
jgi:hypothetical protein